MCVYHKTPFLLSVAPQLFYLLSNCNKFIGCNPFNRFFSSMFRNEFKMKLMRLRMFEWEKRQTFNFINRISGCVRIRFEGVKPLIKCLMICEPNFIRLFFGNSKHKFQKHLCFGAFLGRGLIFSDVPITDVRRSYLITCWTYLHIHYLFVAHLCVHLAVDVEPCIFGRGFRIEIIALIVDFIEEKPTLHSILLHGIEWFSRPANF